MPIALCSISAQKSCDFWAAENDSWKQMFATGTTTEVKWMLFEQKTIILNTYITAIKQSTK